MEGVTSIIVYLFGTTKIWQSLFVTRRICFWIFPFLEHSFNRSVLWWTSITISFPGRFIHGMRVVFECPSFVRTQCSYLSSVRESPESLRTICPMTSDASPTIFITHWFFLLLQSPFASIVCWKKLKFECETWLLCFSDEVNFVFETLERSSETWHISELFLILRSDDVWQSFGVIILHMDLTMNMDMIVFLKKAFGNNDPGRSCHFPNWTGRKTDLANLARVSKLVLVAIISASNSRRLYDKIDPRQLRTKRTKPMYYKEVHEDLVQPKTWENVQRPLFSSKTWLMKVLIEMPKLPWETPFCHWRQLIQDKTSFEPVFYQYR